MISEKEPDQSLKVEGRLKRRINFISIIVLVSAFGLLHVFDTNTNILSIFLSISIGWLIAVEIFFDVRSGRFAKPIGLIAVIAVGIFLENDLVYPKSIIAFRNYQAAEKEYLSKCSASDAHACHQFATAARSWGNKEEAAKYFSVACFLGDKEACADWNTAYQKDKDLSPELRRALAESLCSQGNLESCVQKGTYLIKEGKRDEAVGIFRKACDEDVPSGCDYLGDASRGESIVTAIQYLDKACKLNEAYCWRKGFVCDQLPHRWRHYEKRGELEESIQLCRAICRSGSRTSCWPLEAYTRQVEHYHEDKGDKFKEKGDIINAARHYEKVCQMKRTEFSCQKKEYVCGNVSMGEFLERNPDAREKEETVAFCEEYCKAGIATACGGVSAFYSDTENDFESLRYLKAECDLGKKECRGLELRCTFDADKMTKALPDKAEEIEVICRDHRKGRL